VKPPSDAPRPLDSADSDSRTGMRDAMPPRGTMAGDCRIDPSRGPSPTGSTRGDEVELTTPGVEGLALTCAPPRPRAGDAAPPRCGAPPSIVYDIDRRSGVRFDSVGWLASRYHEP